jgi:hypothetical protein
LRAIATLERVGREWADPEPNRFTPYRILAHSLARRAKQRGRGRPSEASSALTDALGLILGDLPARDRQRWCVRLVRDLLGEQTRWSALRKRQRDRHRQR